MPASAATSCMVVRWKPARVKLRSAASRMILRRSEVDSSASARSAGAFMRVPSCENEASFTVNERSFSFPNFLSLSRAFAVANGDIAAQRQCPTRLLRSRCAELTGRLSQDFVPNWASLSPTCQGGRTRQSVTLFQKRPQSRVGPPRRERAPRVLVVGDHREQSALPVIVSAPEVG